MAGSNIRPDEKKLRKKIVFVVGLMLFISFLHIINIKSFLNSKLYIYYTSFFSDLLLPFGVYFLIAMNDWRYPVLRKWWVKAFLTFSIPTFAEILQSFGIYALGSTFDPLDILMYGIGVIMAVLLEKLVFEPYFSFWKLY